MLSFQETLLHLLVVPVFGIESDEPEEWNCVTHAHDVGDGTHVLLETQVLERADEESDHALEFGCWDAEGEVIQRHGERCFLDAKKVIVLGSMVEDKYQN